MAKPKGDITERSPGRAPRASRPRATAPAAAWVEARPVRETVEAERDRLDLPDAPVLDREPERADERDTKDASGRAESEQVEPRSESPPPQGHEHTPHAEAAGGAGPRSTHDGGASPDQVRGQPFQAELPSAPQDEEDGSVRSGPGDAPAPAEEPASTPETSRQPSDTVFQRTRAQQSKTRRVWLLAGCAALICVAAAAWYWFHGKAGRQPAQGQAQNQQAGTAAGRSGGAKVPVQVSEVQASDVPVYLTGLGAVQAFNTVVVRSRVDGEIQKIGFQEGQVVQAGDLLAQIDPRSYQAALDQVVAKKRQDEATLASNRLDLERTRQLARSSYASQQQLDQQTANVGSITAQIAIDEANIANAQTQLGYATIRAPISGRVGLRLVDQGNIVHASDTTGIVEIAQIQPIAVIFTAPERQLPAIAKAMRAGPVEVAALSSDGKSILDVGRLALINNAVDAASGTVRLKAVFANAEDRLWPGLSVNTRLLQETLRGVTAVPAEAVQRGQDQLFAYVVGPDGKAEKRTIEVSIFAGGRAVVTDGLRVGEQVVTAGQYRLTPGAPVEIRGGGQARDQGAGQGGGTDDKSADTPKTGSR